MTVLIRLTIKIAEFSLKKHSQGSSANFIASLGQFSNKVKLLN